MFLLNEILCLEKKFNYGLKKADPVRKYWFFEKTNHCEGVKLKIKPSSMLPNIFEVQLI